VTVRLLERPGCGLCAETFRALSRVGLDRPLAIERVDIDSWPQAERDRYTLRVPVLVAAGQELDAAGLEDSAIARWLMEVAPER
jgi:hypothetical protein